MEDAVTIRVLKSAVFPSAVFPHWVALIEDKCIGANYERIQEFCGTSGLLISRCGLLALWEEEWYQVFRFAKQEHAEKFMQEFGGELMQPCERGNGKRWAQWKRRVQTQAQKFLRLFGLIWRRAARAHQ
jgi:hypothetical protein